MNIKHSVTLTMVGRKLSDHAHELQNMTDVLPPDTLIEGAGMTVAGQFNYTLVWYTDKP